MSRTRTPETPENKEIAINNITLVLLNWFISTLYYGKELRNRFFTFLEMLTKIYILHEQSKVFWYVRKGSNSKLMEGTPKRKRAMAERDCPARTLITYGSGS